MKYDSLWNGGSPLITLKKYWYNEIVKLDTFNYEKSSLIMVYRYIDGL